MSLLSKRNLLRGNIQLGALVIIVSLCAPLSNAAPIYKVIDEQTGQVTFTDRPQSYEDQAGKQVSQTSVNTGESSAPKGMPNEVRGNTDLLAAAATKPAVNINYQLSMIEPSTERAYQRPAQSIVIALDIKPALQNGDQVSIYLDDKEIAQGLSASVATVDLQPGPHSIRAVVKKVSGQTGQQVNRTVHVIQNTLILQNKKKLAEQLLAYERLPWHQKVLLKMRGNAALSQ